MEKEFRSFLKKEKGIETKNNFLIKIVDMANYIYDRNKTMSPEDLTAMAMQEIIKMETLAVENKIKNVEKYALDKIKEKFPQVDINNSKEESKNEKSN